jgi:hypothetical protein
MSKTLNLYYGAYIILTDIFFDFSNSNTTIISKELFLKNSVENKNKNIENNVWNLNSERPINTLKKLQKLNYYNGYNKTYSNNNNNNNNNDDDNNEILKNQEICIQISSTNDFFIEKIDTTKKDEKTKTIVDFDQTLEKIDKIEPKVWPIMLESQNEVCSRELCNMLKNIKNEAVLLDIEFNVFLNEFKQYDD